MKPPFSLKKQNNIHNLFLSLKKLDLNKLNKVKGKYFCISQKEDLLNIFVFFLIFQCLYSDCLQITGLTCFRAILASQ